MSRLGSETLLVSEGELNIDVTNSRGIKIYVISTVLKFTLRNTIDTISSLPCAAYFRIPFVSLCVHRTYESIPLKPHRAVTHT
jgi:hypothetical protein